jgi:hypothetical protein
VAEAGAEVEALPALAGSAARARLAQIESVPFARLHARSAFISGVAMTVSMSPSDRRLTSNR